MDNQLQGIYFEMREGKTALTQDLEGHRERL